ncbi:MAG TPA: hemolysin secretion protein D [Prevotella sp.]|nr:hemolysin secretion protein D [Prevotella sp.]
MEKERRKQNLKSFIISAAALAILVAGGLFVNHHEVKKNTIRGKIEATQYHVASGQPGRIVELRVQEGDYVHIGDTLAIFETPDMNSKKSTSYPLQKSNYISLDLAKKHYNQVQKLYNKGFITGDERDEAFAAYKIADAQINGINSLYSHGKEAVQISHVEGEVSLIYPRLGQLVHLKTPIMNISMMDRLWGTFDIRQEQARKLKIGDTFTAFVPAFNRSLRMKVYTIRDEGTAFKGTASATTNSKIFELKARPIDMFDGLRPGMELVFNISKTKNQDQG